MAEFKILELDNSKKSAIKTGKWKNPGAKLYDQLLNSVHSKGDVPAGAKEMDERIKDGSFAGWDLLIKEAYMVAPVKDIKNSPHGVTPFSRSGCKYPHHVIKGNKLVVSVPGLRSAYICARNQGVLVNHTPENKAIVAHFNKHFKELGLKPVWHHGEFYLMEEAAMRIEQNFHDINAVLFEKKGLYLFDEFVAEHEEGDEVFTEAVIEGPEDNRVLTSDFAKEVGEETPEALFKWMHENITYDKTISGWKLKNAVELYETKTGNCHDQSYFATFILHSWGYNPGQLFFVEFSKQSSTGGNTHTMTWFMRDKKIYWFENAWEPFAGIHGPYNDLNDLKQAVMDAYNKDDDINSHKFDGIVFGTFSSYKLGMSLGEYVGSWKLTDDRLFDKYDPPMPFDQLPDHLKNDPVHRWRAESGIELIHKEPTIEELNRIWKNWNLMSDEMKAASDKKSIELFGMTNADHYQRLLKDYDTIANSISEGMQWIDRFMHDDQFRESADEDDVKSMSDLVEKCKTPNDLLQWMKCIKYAFLDKDGKTISSENTNDLYDRYRLQSPLQLIRSKKGVCWDCTALEREWFDKSKYPFCEIYLEIQDDEDCPSHTVIIFKEPGESDQVAWFEVSWDAKRGIHWFGDLETCMDSIVNDFLKSHDADPKTTNLMCKSIRKGKKYGCTMQEYMDFAHDSMDIDLGDLFYDEVFNESVADIVKMNGVPESHKAYTMKTLPKIMFFGSRNKHPTVQNDKVFLTPYMGIASIFIVDVSKAIAEEFKRQTGSYPRKLSCNSTTKEWNELEGPDLVRPLKKIHIFHNVKSLEGKTITGSSKGFIHCIDISNIRDDLKLFSTRDPDREVYYDGGKSLKPVEIIEVSVKWELSYSEAKAKTHGEGFVEAASVLGVDNDLEWMNTYMEAGEEEQQEEGEQKPEDDGPPNLDDPGDEPAEDPSADPAAEPPAEEPVEKSESEPAPEEEPKPEEPTEEAPKEEPAKESMPKQTDKAESGKNGVRRKKLYIAFIEWCKEYNNKNTFGSIFDKDAFKVSYPFVPEEMRYFYRLANPMLCVLAGDLTFFPASELRKLNSKNKKPDEVMIFAATPNDLRVFNIKDKKVYRATEENGEISLQEVLGDTFDTYIQTMIQKGDILNGPIEESVEDDFAEFREW